MSVALLESVLAAVLASGGSADVRLETTKVSYQVGEPVVVRVLVGNPRSSKAALFVEPSFWVLPHASPGDARTSLLIDVVGPDGLWIPHQKNVSPLILVQTKVTPWSFVPLLPGQCLGQELVINDPTWGVPMNRLGEYRVSVTLESHAKRWFEGWLKEGNAASSAPFTADQLFDGAVRVGPINLSLVE